MKNYKTFLLTEDSDDLIKDGINTLEIQELSYYDIIDLCELDNLEIDKSYKDKWDFGYCDYIKAFKKNSKLYSNPNYHYLIGIKNNKLVSLFYKYVNTERNIYGDGYIVSTEKGSANKMFLEMKKLGGYTTFSNLENIASIKAQLKIGAEILCLSSNPPDKANGAYNPNITDNKILELMNEEKLLYKDSYTGEDFLFMNKKEEIDIRKLSSYLISNEDIKLVFPEGSFKKGVDDKEESGLKLYFYHKKK